MNLFPHQKYSFSFLNVLYKIPLFWKEENKSEKIYYLRYYDGDNNFS